MTESKHIADLNVGDTIYFYKPVTHGWANLGYIFVKDKIARITPKKTKAVTEKGKELDRYASVYLSLDDDMIESDKTARALLKCYDVRYKLDKARFKELDTENLMKIAEKYQEILDICLEKQII